MFEAAFIGGDYETSIRTERKLLQYVSGGLSGVVHGETALGDTGFLVTPGSGHTINISPGLAYLRGRQSTDGQGSYQVHSDEVLVKGLPVPLPQPFIATTILRAADPEYGSFSGDIGARIDVLSGGQSTSPQPLSDVDINNLNIYGGWTRLSDTRINPADTGTVPGSQFTDVRTFLPSRPGDPISCVSTNRPTGVMGRIIFERDTSLTHIWNGTRWMFLGGPCHGEWRGPTDFGVAHATTWGTNNLTLDTDASSAKLPASHPGTAEYLVLDEIGTYEVEAFVVWTTIIGVRAFVEIVTGDPSSSTLTNIVARNTHTGDNMSSVMTTIVTKVPNIKVGARTWQETGATRQQNMRLRVTRLPG